MVLFTRNVKMIKGAAHKNGDADSKYKRTLNTQQDLQSQLQKYAQNLFSTCATLQCKKFAIIHAVAIVQLITCLNKPLGETYSERSDTRQNTAETLRHDHSLYKTRKLSSTSHVCPLKSFCLWHTLFYVKNILDIW